MGIFALIVIALQIYDLLDSESGYIPTFGSYIDKQSWCLTLTAVILALIADVCPFKHPEVLQMIIGLIIAMIYPFIKKQGLHTTLMVLSFILIYGAISGLVVSTFGWLVWIASLVFALVPIWLLNKTRIGPIFIFEVYYIIIVYITILFIK